jgi:hypothetical protein
MRPLLAAVVFASSATSLLAARFDVFAAGKPVPEAEICITSLPTDGTFVQRLFATSDFRCGPASAEIDLSAGTWQVIARKGSELLSDSSLVMTAEDAKRGSRHRIDVVPAAALDVSNWPLMDGERRFVYVTRTAAAIPIDRDAVVPASVTMVPLAVKAGEITFVGPSQSIPAGSSGSVDRKPREAGHTDLVVPVMFRSVPGGNEQSPTFTAIDAKGRQHRPATAPPIPGAPGTSLLFFRAIPVGTTRVQLSGRRWKATEADVAALDRPVTVLNPGLDAQTTTKLIVQWWTPVDLATLRPGTTASECHAAADPFQRRVSEGRDEFLAVLSRCRDPRKPASDPSAPRCVEVARRKLPENELRGTIAFEDVASGEYSLSFAFYDLPPIVVKAIAHPQDVSEMDAEIRYVTFFGTVTRGGDPLHATVFGATTDADTGRYVAVMTRLPGPYPQAVSPCDGTPPYRFVPLDPPRENIAFDIDVPLNRIVIDVADATTGLPIREATITYAAIKDEESNSAHFAGPAGKADEKGRAVLESVLTNQKLRICARHEDYATECAEPFTMGGTREKTMRLAMERIIKRQGRVIASGPVTHGEVMWWDGATGKLIEYVRKVETDGSFTYQKPHVPGEIVVVTSQTTPLYVFRHPHLRDDQLFDITVPNARVRSFSVKLSEKWPGELAFVTAQIGDLVVPGNAMAWHLAKRRSVVKTSLVPGESLILSDLLETAPISAVLVIPTRAPIGDGDFAYAPERAAFPRQLVGDRGEVVFEP